MYVVCDEQHLKKCEYNYGIMSIQQKCCKLQTLS